MIKLVSLLISILGLLFFSKLTNAAAICGPWNDWQNCIDDRPKPPSGTDQGTYSNKRKKEFKQNIIEPFNRYKEEHVKLSGDIRVLLEKEIDDISKLFDKHLSILRGWAEKYPDSFHRFYGGIDIGTVINNELSDRDIKIRSLINGAVSRSIERFTQLNSVTVNSIHFHYWAKAYAPFISGKWGFESEWKYYDEYNPHNGNDYYTVSKTNKDGADIIENTYSDLWNNANTSPTVKTNTSYVSLSPSEEFINKNVSEVKNKILNSSDSNLTLSESDYYNKVINFDFELMALLSMNFEGDFALQILNVNKSEMFNKRNNVLRNELYRGKKSALLNTNILIYQLSINYEDKDYVESVKNIVDEIKRNQWFLNLPSGDIYRRLMESILNGAGISDVLSIVNSDDFLTYMINEIGLSERLWNMPVNVGDVVPYYRDGEIRLFESKFDGNASDYNWYFPTSRESNNKWKYLGVFTTKENYKEFLAKVTRFSEWDGFTFPGDLHYYRGMYFSPRFIGKASDANFYYPTSPESNTYWVYLGDEEQPSESFFHFIKFSINQYNNQLQQLMLSVSNSLEPMDLNKLVRNTLNGRLELFFDSSHHMHKHQAFTSIDPSITTQLRNQYGWIAERLTKWNDWTEEFYDHLVDINDGYQPSDVEIMEHWANGQWDAPAEFREWWLDTSSYFETDSPSEVVRQLNIFEQTDEIEASTVELANTSLATLINGMNITESMTVSAVSTVTLSSLLSFFIFL